MLLSALRRILARAAVLFVLVLAIPPAIHATPFHFGPAGEPTVTQGHDSRSFFDRIWNLLASLWGGAGAKIDNNG